MTTVPDWLFSPLSASFSAYHRQILLVSGENDWVFNALQAFMAEKPPSATVAWVGTEAYDAAPDWLTQIKPLAQYKQLLGSEFDFVILNCLDSFRLNAMAAIAGTIHAGGTFILLVPPIASWPSHPSVIQPHFLSHGWSIEQSHYIRFMLSTLLNSPHVGLLTASRHTLPVPTKANDADRPNTQFTTPCQQLAFTQVVKAQDAGTRCIALLAKRGRGKSTTLGFLAAHFANRAMRIAVTSSSRAQTTNLFVAAGHYLNDDATDIVWYALDNPSLDSADIDVLIIDEAASVPVPLLIRLISKHPFVILASTTDGYEGSGQGFREKVMTKQAILAFTLETPVRWHNHDPLEHVIDSLLFQSTPLTPLPKDIFNTNTQISYAITPLDNTTEELYSQIMALLRHAHYQTTPDDIVRFIDTPNNKVCLAFANNTLVAAAILEYEGGPVLGELSHYIASGKRRVKGHLTAQALALMTANPQFATLCSLRINRIAVHPNARRQGIGQGLIAHTRQSCAIEKTDLITVSFGATDELRRFWEKSGFTRLKQGTKIDKSSGLASDIYAMAVTPLGKDTLGMLFQTTSVNTHLARIRQFCEGTRGISHLYDTPLWLVGRISDELLSTVLNGLLAKQNLTEISENAGFRNKKEMIGYTKTSLEVFITENKA